MISPTQRARRWDSLLVGNGTTQQAHRTETQIYPRGHLNSNGPNYNILTPHLAAHFVRLQLNVGLLYLLTLTDLSCCSCLKTTSKTSETRAPPLPPQLFRKPMYVELPGIGATQVAPTSLLLVRLYSTITHYRKHRPRLTHGPSYLNAHEVYRRNGTPRAWACPGARASPVSR